MMSRSRSEDPAPSASSANSSSVANSNFAPTLLMPPAPNWYSSASSDLSVDGRLFAYAANEAVVVVDLFCSPPALTMLTGAHTGKILSVSFTKAKDTAGNPATGYLLITGGSDKQVVLWNALSGRKVRAWLRHGEGVVSVMCLPCSSHTEAVAVAVDGGGKFVLWPYGAPETEKSTPVSLSRLNSTQKQVVSCVAAIEQWPGMLVAGLESGAVMVLDSRNAVQTKVLDVVHEWRPHATEVQGIAVSRSSEDAVLVASGAGGDAGPACRVFSLSRTSDGASTSFTSEEHCHISLARPATDALSEAQKSRLWAFPAFLPSSYADTLINESDVAGNIAAQLPPVLCLTGYAGNVHVYQLSSIPHKPPTASWKLPGFHNRSIFTLHFAPLSRAESSTLITTSLDRSVAVWTLPLRRQEGGCETAAGSSQRSSEDGSASTTSATAKSDTAGPRHEIKSLVTKASVHWATIGLGGAPRQVAVIKEAPSNRIVSAVADSTLRVLPLHSTGRAARSQSLWTGSVAKAAATSLAVFPSCPDLLAYGLADGTVCLMHTPSQRTLTFRERADSEITSIHWLDILPTAQRKGQQGSTLFGWTLVTSSKAGKGQIWCPAEAELFLTTGPSAKKVHIAAETPSTCLTTALVRAGKVNTTAQAKVSSISVSADNCTIAICFAGSPSVLAQRSKANTELQPYSDGGHASTNGGPATSVLSTMVLEGGGSVSQASVSVDRRAFAQAVQVYMADLEVLPISTTRVSGCSMVSLAFDQGCLLTVHEETSCLSLSSYDFSSRRVELVYEGVLGRGSPVLGSTAVHWRPEALKGTNGNRPTGSKAACFVLGYPNDRLSVIEVSRTSDSPELQAFVTNMGCNQPLTCVYVSGGKTKLSVVIGRQDGAVSASDFPLKDLVRFGNPLQAYHQPRVPVDEAHTHMSEASSLWSFSMQSVLPLSSLGGHDPHLAAEKRIEDILSSSKLASKKTFVRCVCAYVWVGNISRAIEIASQRDIDLTFAYEQRECSDLQKEVLRHLIMEKGPRYAIDLLKGSGQIRDAETLGVLRLPRSDSNRFVKVIPSAKGNTPRGRLSVEMLYSLRESELSREPLPAETLKLLNALDLLV